MALHIVPINPEIIVRDPETTVRVPIEGRNVPDNSYWRRRLKEGSIKLSDLKLKSKSKPESTNS